MTNLRIPGPTPCADEALKAMSRQMINHRGPEFGAMLRRITDGVKTVFETKNDVFILTTSGTGAMETAVVNFLSPGDRVLCLSIGAFGDRFADIAQTYGADVTKISFDLGKAAGRENRMPDTLFRAGTQCLRCIFRGEDDDRQFDSIG